MSTQIQLRHDTAANWTTVNPILAIGEKGVETDTGFEKTGDGGTAWNSLPYSLRTATTSVAGVVQLTDSTSSTSTTTAATPNAVKLAYDLAVVKADKALTYNTQTGASYTLALTDAGISVEMNNASANTLTVPPNSSVAFPVGTQILVSQYGAGQTTIVAGSGVTIRSNGTKLKLTGQYAQATLVKRATDEWYLSGNLSA